MNNKTLGNELLVNKFRTNRSIINLLFDQTYSSSAGILFNAIAYIYFSIEVVNNTYLTAWSGLVLFVIAMRVAMYFHWRNKIDKISYEETRKILNYYFFNVICSGLIWGFIGGVFLSINSYLHLTITVFILAGISAGMIGSYSISKRLVIGYLIPMIVPTALNLFFMGEAEYKGLAFLLVCFLLFMVKLSMSLNKQILQGVHLGFENKKLLDRLNNASHEIKTPIAAIIGFSNYLLKKSINHQSENSIFLNRINKNANQLKSLVNNILSYSKADHTNEELINRLDIYSELNRVINSFQHITLEKGIKVEVEFESSIPENMYCDVDKFRQVLLNLMSNSVKYTDSGYIKIAINFDFENRKLVLDLVDSGIGISASVKDKLFEPFFRENRSEVQMQEGSGLGLSLSKRFANLMGGDIRLVESEFGSGSWFEFSLTVELAEVNLVKEQIIEHNLVKRESGGKTKKLNNIKVALVEDAVDIQTLFKAFLIEEGAEVSVFSNGKEIVESKDCIDSYDIVLMDIKMPIMNGNEAAKILRARGRTKPILALTAYMPLDVKNQDVGEYFNDYISKSIELDHLSGRIAQSLRVV